MQHIRPDAVVLGQEGVCGSVHDSVVGNALWLGTKKYGTHQAFNEP